MSNSFNGGSNTYGNVTVPQSEDEVISILAQFISDEFKPNVAEDIAEEVSSDSTKQIIIFANSDEQTSPATLGRRDADLIAYGSFVYTSDHDVQDIWENQFEIRETNQGVYIRVSDWLGTTVETWSEKVEKDAMYL